MAKAHRCSAMSTRFWFVADAATWPSLPLRSATASEQQSTSAPGRRLTWLPVRESGSVPLSGCARLGHRSPVAGLDPDASSWANSAVWRGGDDREEHEPGCADGPGVEAEGQRAVYVDGRRARIWGVRVLAFITQAPERVQRLSQRGMPWRRGCGRGRTARS
jgi:hypothetical protein